jgi:hypothetical protein
LRVGYPDQLGGGGDFHTVAVKDATSRIIKFTPTGVTRESLLHTDHTYFCPKIIAVFIHLRDLSPSNECVIESFESRTENKSVNECKYATWSAINGEKNMAAVVCSEHAASEFRFSPSPALPAAFKFAASQRALN